LSIGDAASWPVAAAIRHLEMNLNTMFVSLKNKKTETILLEPFDKVSTFS
jgi:hypothetical protein